MELLMLRLVNWLALMACLLVGCAYNQRYHKPNVPVTNRWSVTDRYISQTDEKNTPYIAWWLGFNDPAFNHLINEALLNNNSLKKSQGYIEAAQGELKKIHYQWIPDLDMMMGYSRNPATGFPGFLAVMIPSYTMNIFQQIKEQKQANYALAQVKPEDDAVKLTVISQMSASYFTYLAEEEHKQLLQVLATDLTHLASIGEKVYKGGLSSNIDPQELYSQVNIIHGEQEIIERNIVVSRNAIRYLINQNPGEIKATKAFVNLNNKHLIPGSLPLTVLENRPDMQVAENRLRASNEGIGLAASTLLPTVQLDLIGGLASGDSRYILPRQDVYFNDQLIQSPLFKFSVLGEIAKARGLNNVSYFNYVDVLQKALRDTTNALTEHERITNKFKQTLDAQRHIAKAYLLNQHLYHRGIQNYVDTLLSKVTLDRMNINVNHDKLQQLLTLVNVYQEVAGGYRANVTTSANAS